MNQRKMNRKILTEKEKEQDKKLKKALGNLSNVKDVEKISIKEAEGESDGRPLAELIFLAESGLSEEQINTYIENKQFVIIDTANMPDSTVEGLYEVYIFFPALSARIIMSVLVEKNKTKLFIMGTDESKLLLVSTFFNFHDTIEMIKLTAYSAGAEIHKYFASQIPDDTIQQFSDDFKNEQEQ